MEQNELYPIFLKVSQLNVLIVGGGKVACEKLSFLLKSSPNANVLVVSIDFDEDVLELTNKFNVSVSKARYNKLALKNKQLVIAATNNEQVNKQIYEDAKAENILINVADTPQLCDFYLGGIVTKGNVKIAISTNGKSPTLAKRLRQFFEEVIPENINDLVENLNQFRKSIKGDFANKVETLNELTKTILPK
ncbi:MAG: bifunctional precorrin-2 dehydrogenase/sirohydrochlorin ferrochelatase [Lutibacter sp.]|uniref:precorrin-2 dehydrogenase/sirohydrochlorin ferrochelatase family protein n=1 Tax=Lutibacter sp. TaxID=1925666 RepID=UPI0019E178CC|nr:bifunctional precorrin-2 dehydrogenase/sirohydrochlorin ferrochelatase [Lutibacter sp.]NOR28651.1 bifunctional precorrin-2 dehydrogenase/sirohydrochlorin ferrochelatase [Lutibacter sp.]